MCVLFTLLASGAFLAAIVPDQWDCTVYDQDRLAEAFRSNKSHCQAFDPGR